MNRTESVLRLIGRERPLFEVDLRKWDQSLGELVRHGRFLVIGGAGSIGQSVVKEIFKRGPRTLHVVDISENNLVELVRDIRSSLGYIDGDFRTFAIDVGGIEFRALLHAFGKYDYIFNLSALKHVRSEKDPFTLMRMVEINILNIEQTLCDAERIGARKYFCVSTDKATNSVNMMGASKRIMELFLLHARVRVPVSTARFANVAFSDGSLLQGFGLRLSKNQPISAPRDVRRFFITENESGVLCLMSCLLGENRDIFFPKLDAAQHMLTFSEIAVRYLGCLGYEPDICSSEDEAREKACHRRDDKTWPCYFFDSETSGEKAYEEFYVEGSDIDLGRFADIGVIRNVPYEDRRKLDHFKNEIARMRATECWTKSDLVRLFVETVPEFAHLETGKYLDDRM